MIRSGDLKQSNIQTVINQKRHYIQNINYNMSYETCFLITSRTYT